MYGLQSADRSLLSQGPANPTVYSKSLQEIVLASDVKWATTASFCIISSPLFIKKIYHSIIICNGNRDSSVSIVTSPRTWCPKTVVCLCQEVFLLCKVSSPTLEPTSFPFSTYRG